MVSLGGRSVGWCCVPPGSRACRLLPSGMLLVCTRWGCGSGSSLGLAVCRKPLGTGRAAGREQSAALGAVGWAQGVPDV